MKQGFFLDTFSLATAQKSFTAEGSITDETLSKRFEANLVAFMQLVEAAKLYSHLPLAEKQTQAKHVVWQTLIMISSSSCKHFTPSSFGETKDALPVITVEKRQPIEVS